MVTANSTVSPEVSTYRVDVVPSAQGRSYQVVRCEPVALFESEEHASFLCELLRQGGHHHG